MASVNGRTKRTRGEVEVLPSGSLRVRVYAGIDPLTKKKHYLVKTIPAGPTAEKQADRERIRMLNEVDERRNPRTKATINQLMDRHMKMLDVERSTARTYEAYVKKHIRPLLGSLMVGRTDAEILDSFYAELRACRDHCHGRRYVAHRTEREHECDARCRPHQCKPLSASSIRQIHWVLSGAFKRAVRWRWIANNPIAQAEPPSPPAPNPHPPTVEEAARIVNEAWRDPDWGTLIWFAMTTGARRGELCALRWKHLDLDAGVIALQRSIGQIGGERWEKDTKSHQQRRVALDPETVDVGKAHRRRCEERAAELGLELQPDWFVFSWEPDGRIGPVPDSVTQRYGVMVRRLGIDTNLHALRHYSATELIAAGVDIRTVAGRLGHGGGGTTTLRVYAAWLSEVDQRAAATLAARMPSRPTSVPERPPKAESPYERIARELRASIAARRLKPGAPVATLAEIAAEHQVSTATARRAVRMLQAEGVVRVLRGRVVVQAEEPQHQRPAGTRSTASTWNSGRIAGIGRLGVHHQDDARTV